MTGPNTAMQMERFIASVDRMEREMTKVRHELEKLVQTFDKIGRIVERTLTPMAVIEPRETEPPF